MANSRTYGAFGLLKKSIGSVVYSRGKDGAGRTIQVVRGKPTVVANPKTVAQILQRAKIKPAQRFYNALADIIDHSWQGIQYGTTSKNYFLSKNLALTGPYIPKSVSQMIPAAYQISEGSIATIQVSPVAAAAAETNVALQALVLDAAAVEKLVAAGVPEGAQLTIIAFVRRQSGEYALAYGRLINNVGSSFEWTGTTAAGANVTLVPTTSTFHISLASGLAAVAVAAIVSQLNGSNWERSTQYMVLTEDMQNGLYGDAAMQITIESYGDVVDVNKLNSEWYLNLANGQAWPGKLTHRVIQIAETGETADVVIGEQVRPNGAIAFYCFTDDGLATGYLVTIDGGTVGVSGDTAAWLVGSEGLLVDMWVRSYATQLGF